MNKIFLKYGECCFNCGGDLQAYNFVDKPIKIKINNLNFKFYKGINPEELKGYEYVLFCGLCNYNEKEVFITWKHKQQRL